MRNRQLREELPESGRGSFAELIGANGEILFQYSWLMINDAGAAQDVLARFLRNAFDT